MSSLKEFVNNVEYGVLSDIAPLEELKTNYTGYYNYMNVFMSREKCTKKGMWAIVDKTWTKQLAQWIGNRKCLEIMAGAGWLSKALNEHGIDIIATDDDSWTNKEHKHTDMKKVYPIETISGKDAVNNYLDRDILIVSWPPYDNSEICRICDEWGSDRPIVYIGEGDGGCCAPEIFWVDFKIEEEPNIKIPQWDGIHDHLMVGYWQKMSVNNSIGQLELSEY